VIDLGIKPDVDQVADEIIRLFKELPRDQQTSLLKKLQTHLADQRRHPRKDYTAAVSYNVEGRDYHDFIQNISAGGVFITTPQPMLVGQKTRLTFPVPGQNADIKISGTIVRIEPDGFGVEFDKTT
jgi:hypothetical protein